MTIIFSRWTMLYEYSSLVTNFADLHLTFKLHAALPLILNTALQQDIISYQVGENFIMGSFRVCCSHLMTVFYFFPFCSPSFRFRVMFCPYAASLLPSSDTTHSEGLLGTSCKSDAETSTWKLTIFTCPRRGSNPQSQQVRCLSAATGLCALYF
jgi:hypothetical protein